MRALETKEGLETMKFFEWIGEIWRAEQRIFGEIWRAEQRTIDMDILWPIIKRKSLGNPDMAKALFYFHVINDAAWMTDYTDEQLRQLVDELI